MVTETQILIALSLALVAGLLALRLGSTLYL